MKKIYIDYYQEEDVVLWQEYVRCIDDMLRFLRRYYKLSQTIFVLLTNTTSMIHLNKQYRNVEKDTNIISLQMDEDELCLGEMILSFKKIQEEYQNKELPNENFKSVYNTIYSSFQLYLFFIVSHGFLHLLGYDHLTDMQEQEMNSEQERLLNSYIKKIYKV